MYTLKVNKLFHHIRYLSLFGIALAVYLLSEQLAPTTFQPRDPYTALWTHWICRHADRELSAVEESDLGYGYVWRAFLYQTHVYRDCAAPCALPRMHTLPAHDACCMGKKYPAAGDATRTGIKIAQGI